MMRITATEIERSEALLTEVAVEPEPLCSWLAFWPLEEFCPEVEPEEEEPDPDPEEEEEPDPEEALEEPEEPVVLWPVVDPVVKMLDAFWVVFPAAVVLTTTAKGLVQVKLLTL